MSYNRYSYSTPSGRHSYNHTNYQSPGGSSRYSSTSTYDRYGSSRVTPSYGSSLGSLSNLSSSRYTSPYTSGSRYSGDFSSSLPVVTSKSYSPTISSKYYSPSSSSTSSYTRSKYLSDSASDYVPYVPRYTKSSYDSDSTYTPRKKPESDYSHTPSKVKFDDASSSKKERKKTEDETISSTPSASSRRRREKQEELSNAARAPDVSSVTRQAENLSLDSGSVRNTSPAANKGNKSSASPAKITQLPHGDGIATKGKSAMNQNVGSEKAPICAKCSSEIRGPFVLALNKSWCPHHFTCDKCNSELVNMGFVELNGKIYCENDYEAFFAPKCGKCRKAIVGDTVNALNKAWHPTCFVCNECNQPISSGAFHVENGLPYCINDWQRLFQIKCNGCNFPVEPGDKWIEALNANWHAECFVCGTCRVMLEGQPFYPKDGKPFCREHVQG